VRVATILIAPDSFKGSASSTQVAQALAQGWRSRRSYDEVICAPFADGGEGTLECVESVSAQSIRIPIRVQGASGLEHDSFWLLVNGNTAVIEMAALCGITTLPTLDAMGAHSSGLGQAISAALGDDRVKEILVTVGGSASTDAGVGALMALGFHFLDNSGRPVGKGGRALSSIAEIVTPSDLHLPDRGIKVLVDVQSPLLGQLGAAHVFARQKGATPDQIDILDQGLSHFLSIAGAQDAPGFGAAGGTSCGLAVLLGAQIVSGVQTLANLIGLDEKIKSADCVITGEGAFDSQSFAGKVVGHILERAKAHDRMAMIACGVNKNEAAATIVSLVELAPSVEAAMSQTSTWLIECGKVLAERFHH
jgi:glycerate kinase